MPMSELDLQNLARSLSEKIFVVANSTAHTDLAGLKAAVMAIDVAMNATTTQINTARPNEVLKLALLDEVKSVAPNFTNQQAGFALVLWVAKEVGFDNL